MSHTRLVHLGGTVWVDPNRIESVEWSSAYERPLLTMRSGSVVQAPDDFRWSPHRAETRDLIVQRLLRLIATRYAETGPATADSEGHPAS